MTPYELRFEIFKQAQALSDNQYHTKLECILREKENNPNLEINYPEYPSYEYIEQLAEKINEFVSKK
jgi:hypothetical protein